jgi:hypothetical protein
MHLSQEYPIKVVCDVLEYPRSQVYYQPQPISDGPNLDGTWQGAWIRV